MEHHNLSETILEKKAVALAYCIKNAREYLSIPGNGMTITATSNYYGGLWLLSAVVISDPTIATDLPSIEAATRYGHGLKTVPSQSDFPHNEFVAVTDRGFFCNFLLWTGLGSNRIENLTWPSKQKFPRSYDDVSETHQRHFVSLTELLSKIPELTDSFENVTGKDATNFRIHPGSNHLGVPIPKDSKSAFIAIEGNYKLEHIHNCKFPLEDITEYLPTGATEGKICKFAGKLTREKPVDVWKDIYEHDREFYVSPLGNYFFISPVFDCINDPLAIHLMTSYLLSILSRYRPIVWREVVEGSLDQYRVLLQQYNRIFRRVVPHLVLNKITRRRNRIPIPGVW